MENPAISVLMPVYNAENYINKSIESILKQSYTKFELLIINDGSTDKTLDIILNYTDERIRLINNPHNFINSLNTGIKEAKGKYIARMDADDYMLPNRLQKQYEFMEENSGIDVCGTWAETFGDNKRKIQTQTSHEELITSMLLYNPMVHPSVMMKKSIFETESPCLYKHDYPCAEDYKLWTDLALKGYCFANIPEVLLFYRSSQNQVTIKCKEEMYKSTEKIQEEYTLHIISTLNEKNKKYVEVLNALHKLYDQNILNLVHLRQIIYQIYLSYFKNTKNS